MKSFGDISSTTDYTSEYAGFLQGEIVCPPGNGGTCSVEVSVDGTNYVPVAGGGWIVMPGNARYTNSFCIPISVNMKIRFSCGSGLSFGNVKIYGIYVKRN